STLEVGGRAGETEGDHALVLVPDIHHPIQLLFTCLHIEVAKQLIPVGAKSNKRIVHLLYAVETDNRLPGLLFVEDTYAFPFLVRFVLLITQHEDYLPALTWLQLNLEVV